MCNWLQAAWATPPHNANVTFILKCREVTFDGWYSDGLYYAATEDENYIHLQP